MSTKYVAYTWLGKRIEGLLDTDSEAAALEQLERDQVIPYKLTPFRRRSLVEMAPSLFRPNEQTVIEFSRQLALLVQSGIPLREALTALREQTGNPGMKEALRRVVRSIEEGEPFSAACAGQPTVFPGFYVRVLRVGESTGDLGVVLEDLARTLERRKAVKDKVRGALLYPLLSLAAAIVATYVLTTYSIPALMGFLTEFGGKLPTATRLLLNISNFLRAYGTYTIVGFAALVFLLLAYTRTAGGSMMRDRLLLNTPGIGRILVLSNMFSLLSTLGTSLRSGVPPIESLHLAAEGVGNRLVRKGVETVMDQVSAGSRLSIAFRQQGVFPRLLSQGIYTGEAAGTLPEVLSSLTDYYEKETERAVGGVTTLIQPAVTLLVAGIVGFVAIAVVSGIYSTMGSVLK